MLLSSSPQSDLVTDFGIQSLCAGVKAVFVFDKNGGRHLEKLSPLDRG